jgi:nucleoside-diphosphate-sugar epimerase
MTATRQSADRLVALTGATGFIGRAILPRLGAAGLPVRALAHRPEAIPPGHDVEWQVGDIRDEVTWDRLLVGVDVVVHCASAGVFNLRAVAENVQTNLPAFTGLMQAAHRHGVRRVVLAGSSFEYGRTGDAVADRGLRETDPLDPTSVHAATKAAIALLAGPLSDELQVETVLLRPFHVYGPGEPAGRLIPAVIAAALGTGPVRTTDGRQVRDLVHLDDVAGAFVAAATAPRVRTDESHLGVFNIATGVATPLAEVIRHLAAVCRVPAERLQIGAVPHRAREMWRLVADVGRARDVLGWSPRVAWRDGLADLVAHQQ